MQEFLTVILDAWTVACELAPWLLFGAILSGVMHFFLPQGFVQRYLNGSAGVLRAVVLGIPLPLCSCGVVPAGIGLKKDGASDGAAIGFLIATPQTGVDSVIASAGILGLPFALFKVVTALITGMIGGYATDCFAPRRSSEAEIPKKQPEVTVWSAIRHGLEIIQSIWLWLVIGVFVSVAIKRLMPDAVQAVGSQGIFASSLLALVISLPLYVCATASLPIAAQLIESGLPVGAVLVFLTAGPATNAATVGAIRSQFGWRTLTVYLVTIIVASILFAAIFDVFFSTTVQTPSHEHVHDAWWQHAAAVVLLGLIVRFAWIDIRIKMGRKPIREKAAGWQISIEGMSCQNCVNNLASSLASVSGASAVQVSLNPDRAVVNGTCSESDLRMAVERAGFTATDFVQTGSAEL